MSILAFMKLRHCGGKPPLVCGEDALAGGIGEDQPQAALVPGAVGIQRSAASVGGANDHRRTFQCDPPG